jgi:hypothetical protein
MGKFLKRKTKSLGGRTNYNMHTLDLNIWKKFRKTVLFWFDFDKFIDSFYYPSCDMSSSIFKIRNLKKLKVFALIWFDSEVNPAKPTVIPYDSLNMAVHTFCAPCCQIQIWNLIVIAFTRTNDLQLKNFKKNIWNR